MGREHATQQQAGRRISATRLWGEYLVAILSGNVIYLFLEPQLPDFLRHHFSHIDPGLALDFLICVGAYGVVRLARGWD